MNRVIAQSEIIHEEGCEKSRVVLHEVGGYQPFVTHVDVIKDGWPAYSGLIWGHYFSDAEAARADFEKRCHRYGVKEA